MAISLVDVDEVQRPSPTMKPLEDYVQAPSTTPSSSSVLAEQARFPSARGRCNERRR